MDTLYFTVRGNALLADMSPSDRADQVTSNSINAHQCAFTFLSATDEARAWTATFLAADGTPHRVALSDGTAVIPPAVTAMDGLCAVGLFSGSGDMVITTNLCAFNVVEGCPTNGTTPGDVTAAMAAALSTASSAEAATIPDGALCTMHFKVEGNQLTQAYQAGDAAVITSNSVHAHVCVFDLDDPSMLWVAVFGSHSGEPYVALVEDGTALIPAEVTAPSGPVTMGLFAAKSGYVQTTNLLRLEVVEGCPTDALVPAADDLDLYRQLLDRVAQLTAQVAANVAASTDSNADYAAELVDARVGIDGTVHPSAGEHVRAVEQDTAKTADDLEALQTDVGDVTQRVTNLEKKAVDMAYRLGGLRFAVEDEILVVYYDPEEVST